MGGTNSKAPSSSLSDGVRNLSFDEERTDRERFERDEQRRRRAATPFERFFPAKSKTNDEYYDSRKWRFERD
jgi:hypothetical protein